MRPVGERAQRILDDGGFRRVPTLNNADPPRYAPMRKAVLRALSPRWIAALEPTVREMANSCVDELERHDTVGNMHFRSISKLMVAPHGFTESASVSGHL
jgi:cytochrome P450